MKKNNSIKTVDICIPVYNEADIILPTINSILSVCKEREDISWSLIIANNGSTDTTAEIIAEANFQNVHLLPISKKGKALAIREAAMFSKADVFGFIDADLSADPDAILTLLDEIIKGADMAVGSRFLDTATVDRGYYRSSMSRLFNIIAKLFLDIPVSDSQCGVKLVGKKGREVLALCSEETWFLDMELLALAKIQKLVVREAPVEWEEFRYESRKSKLKIVQEGLRALVAMRRIREKIKKFKI